MRSGTPESLPIRRLNPGPLVLVVGPLESATAPRSRRTRYVLPDMALVRDTGTLRVRLGPDDRQGSRRASTRLRHRIGARPSGRDLRPWVRGLGLAVRIAANAPDEQRVSRARH